MEEPEDLPGGVIFILPLGGSGEIEAGIVFGLRDFRVPQSQVCCDADAGAGAMLFTPATLVNPLPCFFLFDSKDGASSMTYY